jgi:uncharacterized protein YegP (UPF0339 family)
MEWNTMTRNGVYFFVLKAENSKIVKKAFVVE